MKKLKRKVFRKFCHHITHRQLAAMTSGGTNKFFSRGMSTSGV